MPLPLHSITSSKIVGLAQAAAPLTTPVSPVLIALNLLSTRAWPVLSQVHSVRERKRLFPSSSRYADTILSISFAGQAPSFFTVLHVLHQTALQVGFGIFVPIPECKECLCIPSRSHNSACTSCRPVGFLSMSKCFHELLFIHAGLHPPLPDSLQSQVNFCSAWRR